MVKPVAGSYILLIKLPEEATLNIGRRQRSVHFHRGYYAYIGSAMRGLEARLDRHLRGNKKLHWHIDYLLQQASITSIIICESERKVECSVAQALMDYLDSVPGFGASDCRCHSHLFFTTNRKKMKSIIIKTVKALGLQM